MKLRDIFTIENVIVDLQSTTRDEVLAELLDAVMDGLKLKRDQILKLLIEREKQSATAMNGMVAVPHGRVKGLERFLLAVGRSRMGVEFGADDGATNIFFLLIAPDADTVNHLKILARIARLCRSQQMKDDIMKAKTARQIYDRIAAEEDQIS